MQADESDGGASGFVCPTCGGALWWRDAPEEARPGAHEFPTLECRIGHSFEAAQLWVEHCEARNRALQYAARALAENAALARRLATWTREHANPEAAAALEDEARSEDSLYKQVRAMAGDRQASGSE